MTSIRRELTLGLIGGLAALLWLGGAGLYLHVRRALRAQFDAALAAEARSLAAGVIQKGNRVDVAIEDESLPDFGERPHPAYFQISLEDGRSIERSPSLGARDLPRRGGPLAEPELWDLPLPDGRRGRAAGVRFVPPVEDDDEKHERADAASGGPAVLLVVARDRGGLDRTLGVLLTALLLAGVLFPLGAALLVARVVGRGLRPLSRLADRAAAIDAATLGTRFPDAGLPAELLPISGRLNDLLARLEAAFERERRFTSDAAHELRTPIAELRSLAEVALRYGGDAEASRRGFEDALDVARQMERLVGALLSVARCEAGRPGVARERVDLGELTREALRPLEPRARARGLSVTLDAARAGAVDTDRAMASAMLSNLLANAVDHATPGGRVECRAEAGDWSVANSDESLRPEDLPHLFEPFWRKDAARTDSAHSGLGLTVVAAFARALGVEVRADLPEPGRFRIALRFPPAAG